MSVRIAVLASAAALLLGPPSIRVETVTNPATSPIKDAIFIVTARHHGEVEGFSVTGRAEGLVDGKRVTRPLMLVPVPKQPGVFGVTRQWDADRPWVLVFSIDEPDHGEHGWAEAAVRVAAGGKVLGIDYPIGKWDATPWPRRITGAEIDAALAAMSVR
ncbi:MAG: hypothetical protein ACREK8_10435 [Gemmatimonadales bacterium]